MKKEFSKFWKSSKKKRKQRKYLANAPIDIRRKFLSANLSKELRKKYGRRSFPLRKGDNVKVLRGKFKGKTGKINVINLKKLKVAVEGVQLTKKDGTKTNVMLHPSKLQIIELNLEDKKRVSLIKKEKLEEKKENKSENKTEQIEDEEEK